MNKNLASVWLSSLGDMIPEAADAILMVLNAETDKLQPVARWPEQSGTWTAFDDIVRYTLKKNSRVYMDNVSDGGVGRSDLFAMPLVFRSQTMGVVALHTTSVGQQLQEKIFSVLEQSIHWLQLLGRRQEETNLFHATAMGVLASSIEQESYADALLNLTAELTKKIECDRVAVGEFGDFHSTVVALSNSAEFDEKSNLMQKIADAMDEAIEQDSAIVFPVVNRQLIVRDHSELARRYGSGSIYTRPLLHEGHICGAVSFLRDEHKPFDTSTMLLCDQILALATPYLMLKKSEEMSLMGRVRASLRRKMETLLGFRYLKTKMAAVAATAFLIFACLTQGDFRVTAESILEGKIQRVVASPINGYLVSASARAGDSVKQGEVLATLDSSELELEISKQNAELQKLRGESREALAISDLVKTQVTRARILQTEAELELLQQQLQKTELTAPFDGVIIEGDLSQMLGSPVERGDTLLKLAPLEGYRIILKVDERSIAHVKTGQSGVLTLTSMPNQKYQLSIDSITKAAQPGDGVNIFRVEASLDDSEGLLRPGMEGIGKIHVGRGRLLWIWTHDMIAWLRLWFWSWQP